MFLSMTESLVWGGHTKMQLLTEFLEMEYMLGDEAVENYRFLGFYCHFETLLLCNPEVSAQEGSRGSSELAVSASAAQ